MVDVNTQNKTISVNVSSSGVSSNVNTSGDTSHYYSEKSKEWAISDKIVDNADYSSKYYANESKKQADISTAKATEVVESGNNAISNIESARDNAITNITNQESLAVDKVNTAGATQVALATEQATIATSQASIATSKTTEVVESGNAAISNIETAKSNAINEINTTKTSAVSSVNSTKNTAISEINTTKTNAVNAVNTSKKEALDAIAGTGVNNLANKDLSNLSTAGQEKFDEKVNVDDMVEIDMSDLSPLVDGQWVNLPEPIFLVSGNSKENTADLSDILPNDGYNYELLLFGNGQASTGASVSTRIMRLGSDIISPIFVAGYTATAIYSCFSCSIAVGTQRYITYNASDTMAAIGLRLQAYRRLGTNV